jgi:peptidylprolyl isomerase
MRRIFALALTAMVLAGCAGAPAPSEETAEVSDVLVPPDATALLESLYPNRDQPPGELSVTVVEPGGGEQVSQGDQVVVQYWGVRWSDGETFDASWTRGQPFTFRLGAGEVISGWDLGIEGMSVGDRSVLVIPPDLGYGDRGAGDVIGPGETLVFVVDLVERQAP